MPGGTHAFQIYALYERNKKLLIFLLVLCTLQVGAMATLIGVTMSQLKRVWYPALSLRLLILGPYRRPYHFDAHWLRVPGPTSRVYAFLGAWSHL